uniref:Uncharacterized protein n=1 Tax=Arundo donax TaxID=35708 RepID=A0A0A8YAX7_ARUDO
MVVNKEHADRTVLLLKFDDFGSRCPLSVCHSATLFWC